MWVLFGSLWELEIILTVSLVTEICTRLIFCYSPIKVMMSSQFLSIFQHTFEKIITEAAFSFWSMLNGSDKSTINALHSLIKVSIRSSIAIKKIQLH